MTESYSTSSRHGNTTFRLVQTDKLKAEIQEALPISAVAERLCDRDLIRAGHQYKALCPLHVEDTPSFYINDAKNAFHCFGCQAGGDAIALVREVHHLSYADALYRLADEAGVDIAKYERPLTDEEKQVEALRQWCEAWMARVTARPDFMDGRAGILGRNAYGVFQVDAPPPDLPAYFNGKEWLFNGTIFPYRASNGRLVGWKARRKDKSMFLVPGDFPLWEPVVWGLDVALPHIERALIVVEGEYDAIALAQAGVRNVVAIGGSKWTDEQMAILEDHRIREVLFWFDGDEAGVKAAESVAKRFWNHPTIQVRIAQAPQGSDPEDVVVAIGAHVPEGRVALEWLLRQEWDRAPRTSLGAKLEYVRWIREEYGQYLTGLEESLVLKTVASWLDVPEADVLDFARAEQTLLQAPESEKAVLGRCVRDGAYYRTLRKRMVLDDFHVIKHRRLWKVLEDYLTGGLEWDVRVIGQKAEAQGVTAEYVEMLAEVGDLNIGWHEDRIMDFSVRRGARADADRFRDLIADLRTPANQLIGTLTHAVTSKALQRGASAFRSIVDQVDSAVETMHARMKNPNELVGISFGSQLPTFDRNTQGIQPRRLYLIAATSSKGKSTIAGQWAVNWAVGSAVPVDFISLEMDETELLFKAASHLTGIDSMKISSGRLTEDEAKRVEKAMLRLRSSTLRIYAPDSLTTDEWLLYAREAVMERRTEVFVIDYAQMVGADGHELRSRRDEQLRRFAYESKLKVARGMETAVLIVAQLKRDAANKEEPTMEDMADCYDLSRAADVGFFLSQAEDSSLTDGWIGKNRQGPPGVRIPMHFDKPTGTFSEPQASKVPAYRILS